MNPLDLIYKEMNCIADIDGVIDLKKLLQYEELINKMRERNSKIRFTFVDKMYEELEKAYKYYKNNNIIDNNITYEDFKNYYFQIVKIKDLKYLNFEKFQLNYEELDTFQRLVIIFWITNSEYNIKKYRRNSFNRLNILMNLEELLSLKSEKNNDKLKNKLYDICEKWGIVLRFEIGVDDGIIDGYCKWNQTRPFILIRERNNAKENYKEFIILFAHIMSDSQKLAYYDTKLIKFGDEFDNYIHDYQVIKANRFIKNNLNLKFEG